MVTEIVVSLRASFAGFARQEQAELVDQWLMALEVMEERSEVDLVQQTSDVGNTAL